MNETYKLLGELYSYAKENNWTEVEFVQFLENSQSGKLNKFRLPNGDYITFQRGRA